MCDDHYLLEVVLDGLDGPNEPLQPGRVLRAEPLVYEQRGQRRARPVSQQPGQRDTQGEVYPERLSAAVGLIAACAQFVGYLDVQGLPWLSAAAPLPPPTVEREMRVR